MEPVILLAAGAIALAAKAIAGSSFIIPIDKLVDPISTKVIADDISQYGGDFALNAWKYVGSNIGYSFFGSHLHFFDSSVKCAKCSLPMDVAVKGQSNCVGKAALLTSILRDRYSSDEVYMVVGQFKSPSSGLDGGHAWVNIKRDGIWYVMESTSPPPISNTWRSAYDLSDNYMPDAWVNDDGLICYDPEVCSLEFSVSECPCKAHLTRP